MTSLLEVEIEAEIGEQQSGEPPLIARAAGSAAKLFARFGIITIVSGLTTIALTRTFGAGRYGPYATALATWSLLGAIADFGLTPMLSRDTVNPDGPPSPQTFRNAYVVATIWCTLLSGVEVLLAISAGVSTVRGTILLILVPGMLLNSLNPARTVFVVLYRTGILLTIDAISAVVQSAIVIAFLITGRSPEAIAGVVMVSSVVNNLVVLHYADLLLQDVIDPGYDSREVIRRAAPLALMSVLVQVYFTIDLVLLGWLEHGKHGLRELGYYAAASKLLQLLAGVSGVVVSGSLPALSATASDGGDLDPLIARIWQWLLAVLIPVFVTVIVTASIVIRVAFGHEYAPATPLLRILCLTGIVSPICNIVGSCQLAMRKTKQLFFQNFVAAVFNVAGNLILVPLIGVVAAAWMTLATDVLVGGLAIYSLRHEVGIRQAWSVTPRPMIALAAMAAVELALLSASPWISLAGGAVALIAVSTALRAWPPEFVGLVRRLVPG